MNPCQAYGSLGGIQGKMAGMCLDGWVCDSGDIWARDGNLGSHVGVQLGKQRAEWISPLLAPLAWRHCAVTDLHNPRWPMAQNLHFISREMK